MCSLVQSSGAASLRFWGKIKGSEKDYYVAEGTLEGGGEEGGEEGGEQSEPRGSGVNQFVYWVCNSPLGEWTKLPDLKPSQILQARGIKVSFTGDIDRKIYTNPFYFESEKIYLRAQIARISASTTLIPKGLYRFVEESTRDIEENTPEEGELEKPSTKAMSSLDMWLHHTPSILKQGRVKHLDPVPGPGDEEVEPEELMKREVDKDPWEPRLKPVTSDTAAKGGLPAWVLRSYNLETDQIDPKTGKVSLNYGTIVIRSQWWPGAYCFYNQGRNLQIYVGDGQKNEPSNVSYYPVTPPVMMEEREERVCYTEPA